MDEGYIKFQCDWQRTPPLDPQLIREINTYRQQLYRKGLIGVYPNGIGFGNISQRLQGDQFIISGSATGQLEVLNENHYTLVTQIDIDRNWVECQGPIIASSESMSHATVYQAAPNTKVVIHVHHLELWERLKDNLPTTREEAAYGTPEMAYEILRLFEETDASEKQLFVMAGHKEGIIAFGERFESAMQVLFSFFSAY